MAVFWYSTVDCMKQGNNNESQSKINAPEPQHAPGPRPSHKAIAHVPWGRPCPRSQVKSNTLGAQAPRNKRQSYNFFFFSNSSHRPSILSACDVSYWVWHWLSLCNLHKCQPFLFVTILLILYMHKYRQRSHGLENIDICINYITWVSVNHRQ